MAKQAYVYSGTEWVPLASEVTNLSSYQTKALNQFPYRNLIINGDMQVAQRGTSAASLTTSGYRTVDRWQFQITTQGTWTMSQENDAPTGSGFRNSTKVLCTTADASPAAGDNVILSQTIEGQNLQQIKKGTASAEQLTLSFWVKSNVTGTYIFEIYDGDNARQISKSYTISASATWEKKTITIPADTTGVFDNDNNASVFIQWWLGAGSTFTSGTLNSSSWASATSANRAVGQTNLASATNNYWQITGVQLEVGDTATPFEFLPAHLELMACQRYYYRNYGSTSHNYVRFAQGHAGSGSTTLLYAHTYLPVTLRAIPSSIDFSNLGAWNGGNPIAITAATLESCSPSVVTITYTSSTLTGNGPYAVIGNNNASAYLGINAEL